MGCGIEMLFNIKQFLIIKLTKLIYISHNNPNCLVMKSPRLLFIILCSLITHLPGYAQEFYITNGAQLQKVTISAAGCTSSLLAVCQGLDPTTIALYQDTLYSISSNFLKRSVIANGIAASCSVVGQLPTGFNSMTADSTGMLYAAQGTALYKINPRNGTWVFLGSMPHSSAGDLLFYKGKLYMAASSPVRGIIKVDINNPSQSTMYIPIPQASIFGMVNVAISCNENRIYAMSVVSGGTDIIELNMDLATIVGTICRLPYNIGDAASSTETGLFTGIKVRNINVVPECKNKPASASIQVNTISGITTYTYLLNNITSNTTGLFTGLTSGSHRIHISSAGGCELDTIINVATADTPRLQMQITHAFCSTLGNINSIASAALPPYKYSLNNGPQQATGIFGNLIQGNYLLGVTDSNACISRENIQINQVNPPLTRNISITDASCNLANGIVTINTIPGSASGYSINNGMQQTNGQFNNIAAGNHTITTFTAQGCRYDSLITVGNIIHPAPAVTINSTAPDCFNRSNGSVSLVVNGTYSPYQVSFNNGAYTNLLSLNNVSAGICSVKIKDAGGCITDTGATVPVFVAPKPAYTFLKDDPTCSQLRGGSFKLSVLENPDKYKIRYGNTIYPNDFNFRNLMEGNYFLEILDNNSCPADSVTINLNLLRTGKCDTVYVPSAFTPDKNGKNDVFKGTVYGAMSTYSLAVYNRLGELVFFSKNDLQGWNGMYRGIMQPAGAYIWMLSYTPADGRQRNQKGSMVLIR
jgi:gliding motility-associated-like protein